jgi:ABC-2 type transport system permease protein
MTPPAVSRSASPAADIRPEADDRSAARSVLVSAARVFDLSFGQMLWSRRSIFMGLLLGAPLILAAAVRAVTAATPFWRLSINGTGVNGAALFGMMMWLLYIRFSVPVLGVFYGTALIADEVEDKTVTYLFTRPIRRGAVLIGKYLAYLASTSLLMVPSVVVAYFLIVPVGGGSVGEAFPALLTDLGVLVAGLTAYGAVFAWVGARLRRPLVIGLVFALGWEPAVVLFPGYLKRLTVAYYLQALVPHAMPQDSSAGILLQAFREVPSIGTSLVALTIITVISLWSAARATENREYVLDQ